MISGARFPNPLPDHPLSIHIRLFSWTAEGKREVGYWIDRAFWGRGVATEALSAFLCLEQTRPLYAGVAKHNVASIRVLQKCGFKLSHFVEEASNDADASYVLLTLAV
ncbi:MAG TPA: GNAT family N-acetyltransferase [Chthoniobacterales bacterium]|nr:GNAT family N-acetyltransferase [Chthoniobacterales bacterium]